MGTFAIEKKPNLMLFQNGSPIVMLSPDSPGMAAKSNSQEKQDKQASKKQENQKKADIEVEVKQVPKAKRQMKPVAVKANIKVKPIKIIRPKIKKP
jgi:hypothetical protein